MIGKVIKSLLVANTDLLELVAGDSIFPYVLNENIALPAIIYTIDSTKPEYTKDGWAYDNITFSVISMSENYNTLQDIVLQVRLALELERGDFDDITIESIYMSGLTEGFNLTENVFMNRLTFTVLMKSY